ncbi:hypothetical protein DRO41_00940 [Candidatus Bathyarchaeota archaeon]|nr:MAG: hypothetical protein DRO41_00940 [Candidatus Bathyarchaeota archaeon]
MLTAILSRAVPSVWVESAGVVHWPSEELYFINVIPTHGDYWVRFKMRYPHYRRIALEYGAKDVDVACPVFPTLRQLLDWLIVTLDLSQGERALLHLWARM